jgi:hypothetical protein
MAVGGVERGVRKALRRVPAEHRTGGLAATALELARAIDYRDSDGDGPDPRDLAALSRELRATLTELARFEAPGAKGGAVDDLKARRQKRRGA